MLLFGTTPDVTAVVEFDGRPVGDGKPGPVSRELGARLTEDILHNPARAHARAVKKEEPRKSLKGYLHRPSV